MLQQTQVATVLPYYARWMARFPTLESLADAEEDEALALWQGLGYYQRCRRLLAGVRHVARHGWPTTVAEWRGVPGVGPYTAGALASIGLGLPTPVVDGNVERVALRLLGSEAIGTAAKRMAWAWAEANVDASRPGDWNQALMELGATVCRPRTPDCQVCPLISVCRAWVSGSPERYPSRAPRRPVVRLDRVIVVPWVAGRIGMRQAPADAWNAGLWEFPTFEPDKAPVEGETLGRFNYTITHHRIRATVVLVDCWCGEGLTWFLPVESDLPAMASAPRRALRLALRAVGPAGKLRHS